MFRAKTQLAFLFITAVTPLGCGEGSAPGVQDLGGAQGDRFHLSARIDGVDWAAQGDRIFASTIAPVPGSLGFQGFRDADPASSFTLSLFRIPGVGSYPMGMNVNTMTGGSATVGLGVRAWSTPLTGEAGTVTITEITTGRVRGTFSFTANINADPADEEVTVSDGEFEVPLSATYSGATSEELGHRVRATIDGAPWNAATAVVLETSSSSVFTSSNSDLTLTIVIPPATSPGSTSLGGASYGSSITLAVKNGASYGGTPADQGLITVTSVSATRLQGTFTASLAPSTPGSTAPALAITEGTFDLRR